MGNFIEKFQISTLPTNVGLEGFQYPLIRTNYKALFQALIQATFFIVTKVFF